MYKFISKSLKADLTVYYYPARIEGLVDVRLRGYSSLLVSTAFGCSRFDEHMHVQSADVKYGV